MVNLMLVIFLVWVAVITVMWLWSGDEDRNIQEKKGEIRKY